MGEQIGRTNLPELRKRIGWVSDSLETLIRQGDVAENIVFAGSSASTTLWYHVSEEVKEKAKSIMTHLGCLKLAKRPYRVLSQGERRKILISRALMTDPPLLVLDEPCAGLDIAAREHFLRDLKGLLQLPHPPNIIMVTHHMEEILPFFDKILMLKAGRVFQQGPVDKLLTDELLSELFNMPIGVQKSNGRYYTVYSDE